jgi:2',3'-cyclic-nucleotide 2'-phosphodiesterase (5'-nucleotidase family)
MNSGVRKTFVVLALVSASGLACAVYNDSCPVTDPQVWGQINVELDIRREFIRQCEAPVGNFVADAMLNYDYGLKDVDATGVPRDVSPSVALINAGAIRESVVCGQGNEKRESIPRGPVTDQDIFQLLPFVDTIVVIKMTGSQLEEVLEWGVSGLNLPGDDSAEGHFLQMAGEGKIEVNVDCAGDPQTLDGEGKVITNPGGRISSVCVGTGDPCFVADGTYYVATLDYITGKNDLDVPNDGFASFHGAGIMEKFETHVPLTETVRSWLAVQHEADYPKIENRMVFQNCDDVCGN